jgi:hypothetical protein
MITRSIHASFPLALTLLFAAPGCGDTQECGPGTHIDGESCVASLSPECGPGTKLEAGRCVPDSGGGAECGTGTHSEAGTCVPDIALTGNAARWIDVNLTNPAEFIPLANGPFHDAFASGENLIFVGTYAPSTGSAMRLYGGGGTLNPDGSYALDHTHAFDATASGPSGQMVSAPFTFAFKAFGAPQYIVLVDTVITNGTMDNPEGINLVRSGKLTGVLTPENAQAVFIQDANVNLLELMVSIDIQPDVDRDHDGTKESFTMGVTFATIPAWVF